MRVRSQLKPDFVYDINRTSLFFNGHDKKSRFSIHSSGEGLKTNSIGRKNVQHRVLDKILSPDRHVNGRWTAEYVMGLIPLSNTEYNINLKIWNKTKKNIYKFCDLMCDTCDNLQMKANLHLLLQTDEEMFWR